MKYFGCSDMIKNMITEVQISMKNKVWSFNRLKCKFVEPNFWNLNSSCKGIY